MRPDGEKIKEMRRDRGWSQATLADRARLSESTIKNAETGRTKSTYPETLRRISEAFGLQKSDEITIASHDERPRAARLAAHRQRYLDFDPVPVRACLPSAPVRCIGRAALLEELIDRVFQAFDEHISGATRNLTVLHGEGGNGKTTFLRALLNDDRVVYHFGDNRLWTCLGPGGDPRISLQEWCDALGVTPWLPKAWKLQDAQQMLTHRIGGRPMLIGVDDAWEKEQLIPLLCGASRSVIVVTTRRTSLANEFAPTEGDRKYLGSLSEDDGLELLRVLAGSAISDGECRKIVQAVRGHALAVELAGLQLRMMLCNGEPTAEFLEDLRQKTEEVMRFQIPEDSAAYREDLASRPTVFGLFEMSVDRLDGPTRKRFSLAGNILQPEPAHFDVKSAAGVWQTSEADAQRTLNRLVGEGLLQVVREGRYQIHQMLSLFAKVYMRRRRNA